MSSSPLKTNESKKENENEKKKKWKEFALIKGGIQQKHIGINMGPWVPKRNCDIKTWILVQYLIPFYL